MLTLSMLKIRAAVAVAALTIALVPPALHAQFAPERTQAVVPFAFEVGSTHFAPGTYILSKVGENIVLVQNGKHSVLTMSSHETGLKPPATSKVVFYRYGNQYFLREIWRTGDPEYLSCQESKDERSLRREMHDTARASIPTHSNVDVALLQLPR
jgi:hypothetical protein